MPWPPLRLAIIYSRKDTALLQELLDHLSPLEFQAIIEVWHDRNLEPGAAWREETEAHLKSAHIVLILVSASCLASPYCRAEIELTLKLHEAKRLHAIPVKLHDVDWEGEPLAELQLLPRQGQALAASPDRHAEMAGVARAVRKLVLRKTEERTTPASPYAHREAAAANDLALTLADLGDLSSARAHLEAALQIAQETESNELPILLSNYAHILRQVGELEAARVTLEKALACSSPSDPSLAIRLDRLAGVLRDLGAPELARERAERALAVSVQAHGKDAPSVAVRHNTLGLIWMDLGKPEKAIGELQEALSILQRCRDENHPSIAAVRGNLALALRDRGDLDAAKSSAQRALADDSKFYSASHTAVAADLNTLGLILRDRGEISAAGQCLESAQKIFSDSLGDLHPSTRAVRENLQTLTLKVA